MSVVDGENRRTACHREVSCLPSFSTSTLTTSLSTTEHVASDDLYVTAQQPSFVEVETTIEESLSELTQYYISNNLRANPDKTQVTAFHLRNKEAKRTLKVKGNRTDLENTPHPKYLGVTLDRTLSYKHIHNTKMKVATRNNLIRKLSSSKCGTNASTIRTTAFALSYSVAEYGRDQHMPTNWIQSSIVHAEQSQHVSNQLM